MIQQLGSHGGKQVIFGFDRYLVAELDEYTTVLSRYGIPVPAVNLDDPYYLTSAQRVCERVKKCADRVGILVCSTGMGMSIAANKFRGIYAARCLTIEDAELARTNNNANVLCLAARIGLARNAQIIHAFMTTPFEGEKLDELEDISCLEREGDPLSAPAVMGRAGKR